MLLIFYGIFSLLAGLGDSFIRILFVLPGANLLVFSLK